MRKRLLIILIAVAVLVVPIVIAVFVINRSPGLQNTVLKLANITTNDNINAPANTNNGLNVNAAAAADLTAITFVSRNFAETYGSGSNQNGGSNIVAAEQWASRSYVDVLKREISRLTNSPTAKYTATTTRALVVNVTKQTASTAAVTVGTQRQETVDKQVTDFYQDIFIDLVKDNSGWKVNAAKWKAR